MFNFLCSQSKLTFFLEAFLAENIQNVGWRTTAKTVAKFTQGGDCGGCEGHTRDFHPGDLSSCPPWNHVLNFRINSGLSVILQANCFAIWTLGRLWKRNHQAGQDKEKVIPCHCQGGNKQQVWANHSTVRQPQIKNLWWKPAILFLWSVIWSI